MNRTLKRFIVVVTAILIAIWLWRTYNSNLNWNDNIVEETSEVTAVEETRVVTDVAETRKEVEEIEVVEQYSQVRGEGQVPHGCTVVGMCPLAFDIPAKGLTIVTGSPFEKLAWGLNHPANASIGEGTVLVFFNDTTLTHSVTLNAWSGSNSISAFVHDTDAEFFPREIANTIVQDMVTQMKNPELRNCTEDGCYASVEVLYYICAGNDSCSQYFPSN